MENSQNAVGFVLEEIKGNLFTCSNDASLCHCVSKDFKMGLGIATTFKEKFGNVEFLKNQKTEVGKVAVLKEKERYVYYLVTKQAYWHKPTLKSLTEALISMRLHALGHGVSHICMPKIGCGLDRLKWKDVHAILCNVFERSEIKVSVYIV